MSRNSKTHQLLLKQMKSQINPENVIHFNNSGEPSPLLHHCKKNMLYD